MSRCSKCREFVFSSGHQCAPVFVCESAGEDADDGYGPIDIHAHFADEAAAKYADEWDQDERMLLRSDGMLRVKVTTPEGSVEHFNVSGEAEPVYHAYRVRDGSGEAVETAQTGSTEGDSPTAEGGDAQKDAA